MSRPNIIIIIIIIIVGSSSSSIRIIIIIIIISDVATSSCTGIAIVRANAVGVVSSTAGMRIVISVLVIGSVGDITMSTAVAINCCMDKLVVCVAATVYHHL